MNDLKITCYSLWNREPEGWAIVNAVAQRNWMNQTRDNFAYRCLPLKIINELGYWILCPTDVALYWDGTPDPSGLQVIVDEQYKKHIASHFGHGVLSFSMPWMFRTNIAGIGLRVGGVPNLPPPMGLLPLDGLVETWEQNLTFTMNWKVMVAKRQLMIKAGFPICCISPHSFWDTPSMEYKNLSDMSEQDQQDYLDWTNHRKSVLSGTPIDDNRNHYTKALRINGCPYTGPHWTRIKQ